MKKLWLKFWRWFLCLIGEHDWTSAHDEGIDPSTEQLGQGAPGFLDYAKVYCRACGKVSGTIWP